MFREFHIIFKSFICIAISVNRHMSRLQLVDWYFDRHSLTRPSKYGLAWHVVRQKKVARYMSTCRPHWLRYMSNIGHIHTVVSMSIDKLSIDTCATSVDGVWTYLVRLVFVDWHAKSIHILMVLSKNVDQKAAIWAYVD